MKNVVTTLESLKARVLALSLLKACGTWLFSPEAKWSTLASRTAARESLISDQKSNLFLLCLILAVLTWTFMSNDFFRSTDISREDVRSASFREEARQIIESDSNPVAMRIFLRTAWKNSTPEEFAVLLTSLMRWPVRIIFLVMAVLCFHSLNVNRRSLLLIHLHEVALDKNRIN